MHRLPEDAELPDQHDNKGNATAHPRPRQGSNTDNTIERKDVYAHRCRGASCKRRRRARLTRLASVHASRVRKSLCGAAQSRSAHAAPRLSGEASDGAKRSGARARRREHAKEPTWGGGSPGHTKTPNPGHFALFSAATPERPPRSPVCSFVAGVGLPPLGSLLHAVNGSGTSSTAPTHPLLPSARLPRSIEHSRGKNPN